MTRSPSLDETNRVLRYLAVGLASFLVFFIVGSLPLLLPGLSPPLATGIAVVISSIVNFLGHRHFTFTSRRPLMESLPRYGLLVGFNSLLGAGIVALLSEGLAMPVMWANAVSLVAITASAYLILQKLVI